MSAAAHFTTDVYGTVAGQPPYTNSAEQFANFDQWKNSAKMSFPTTGTVFHTVNPGVRVGTSSNYIYSVIEVIPSGLVTNPRSTKYASNDSVTTLATAAG